MKLKENSSFWPGAGLIFATLLYSCYGIWSRLIGNTIPLFYQNATRALLASCIVAIVVSMRKEWAAVSKTDFAWISIRSLVNVIATAIFIHTVLYLPLGTFYFLFYAGSVTGGYLFGRIFLGDKFTVVKIVSLIIAGIGLALIFSVPSVRTETKYLFYAMISGIGVSLFNILSAKISSKNTPLLITFLDNAISLPLYMCFSFIASEKLVTPDLNIAWGANLIFAFTMLGTGSLIVYGFRHLDSHIGSLLMLTEILFASFFGYVLYKEMLQPMTIFGGICIIIALSIVHIKKINRSSLKPPQISRQ